MCVTFSKSAASLILFVINQFSGFARHASKLRVYKTTLHLDLGVEAQLAHVKSVAFKLNNIAQREVLEE